jgi:hypothetical protein
MIKKKLAFFFCSISLSIPHLFFFCILNKKQALLCRQMRRFLSPSLIQGIIIWTPLYSLWFCIYKQVRLNFVLLLNKMLKSILQILLIVSFIAFCQAGSYHRQVLSDILSKRDTCNYTFEDGACQDRCAKSKAKDNASVRDRLIAVKVDDICYCGFQVG